MKNLKVRVCAFALAGITTFTLVGCDKEKAPIENYDILSATDDELTKGLTQELEVPNNDFKLVTEYYCDDEAKRKWRITSDKFLYYKVYTKGLDENTEVYIDNVHIDTSIKSEYASFDGIIQDTMDDHVHNSQMIGFPIANDTYYYGVNAIEGSNEQFIQGYVYGYQHYVSGSIESERVTEDMLQKYNVYGNKFQIVYDLLVKKENDKEFSNISISTDFLVYTTDYEEQLKNELSSLDNNEKEKVYSK